MVLHEDRETYPAEAYVFAVSLNMFPMCYQWVAKEEEHIVIPKPLCPAEKGEGVSEKQVLELARRIWETGSIPHRKREDDNCIREPYVIEMNSAFYNLPGAGGKTSRQEVSDYREAISLALYYGLKSPENEHDPQVQELLSLDDRLTGEN